MLSFAYPDAYKSALSQKMKGAAAFRKGQEFQAIQHFMEGMLQLVEGIPIFAIEEEILQEGEVELTDALLSNIVAAMVKPRVSEPVTVKRKTRKKRRGDGCVCGVCGQGWMDGWMNGWMDGWMDGWMA